ncbi:DUF3151 domain-containing protein [Mycetocola zhujimingii]|nr:DUF3151 domain-containing protein [Mycetocola zhujimingii]
MTGDNLLGMPETRLPFEPEVVDALDRATTRDEIAAVAAKYPKSSLAWARLAEATFDRADPITAYAYARVGYHRGLDALRKAGWRGQGPIPWNHTPNQGVLRSLYALRQAADAIGETDEVTRLTDFLRDADETAVARIESEGQPSEPQPPTEAFFIRGQD